MPATCAGATMTVVPGKDESTITYTVPESWLSDPARKYPVTIDPSVSTSSADTYTCQSTRTTPTAPFTTCPSVT